uniref:Uncharacterized protein n=1 Tax=Ananas comosus var. bracteatus TaxID=296719 RepID=A0A6V7QIW3_ANACO|nr:unnamed protein product [Ananas comosus var. bracteatus]
MEQLRRQQQHFLVVTYPAQGHINPSQHLARRLARSTGARVTFSTAVSAHRRMFPSLSSPDQEFSDGLLSYIPYSDGSDDASNAAAATTTKMPPPTTRCCVSSRLGRGPSSAVLDRLSARDERVTCVVYTILLPWVADVARPTASPRCSAGSNRHRARHLLPLLPRLRRRRRRRRSRRGPRRRSCATP